MSKLDLDQFLANVKARNPHNTYEFVVEGDRLDIYRNRDPESPDVEEKHMDLRVNESHEDFHKRFWGTVFSTARTT